MGWHTRAAQWFIVGVGWLAPCGCSSSGAVGAPGRSAAHETNPATPLDLPAAPFMKSPYTSHTTVRALDLSFDVVRAELPVTGLRESRKIWNHVDELRTDATLTARLARNGLRVGVAASGSWPAMLAVLEAGNAEFRREQLFPQRGLALAIALGTVGGPESGSREGESIFSYDRNNRLVGKTYPGGEKVLNIDYAYQPQLGGLTETQLQFEVRYDRGVMTWEREGGIIRQVPSIDRHLFDDLAVPLALRSGEFLVIGANADTDNAFLIGNRFLLHTDRGLTRETLLFITPRPVETRTAQSEPP
jgi:hypothetical protein